MAKASSLGHDESADTMLSGPLRTSVDDANKTFVPAKIATVTWFGQGKPGLILYKTGFTRSCAKATNAAEARSNMWLTASHDVRLSGSNHLDIRGFVSKPLRRSAAGDFGSRLAYEAV